MLRQPRSRRFGLWLNLPRLHLRRAAAAAQGVAFALSSADPERAWAEALALDPGEEAALFFRLLADRRAARVATQPTGEA